MCTVGVVLGGVAPEHEVSIISALQAAAALDRERYTPVPLYIAKDGTWYTGDALLEVDTYRDLDALRDAATPVALHPGGYGTLRVVEVPPESRWERLRRPPLRRDIDVMLLGLHGGPGEDGSVQGLCEAMGVPYTGSGVLGSAVGMDKGLSKQLCQQAGIPVVDFVTLRDNDWAGREDEQLTRCLDTLGLPLIVKPARLGSSIGIARADTRAALDAAIEDALRYDDKVIVEKAVSDLREINCSVLGTPTESTASVLEEPVPSAEEDVLSFQDKYMRESDNNAGGTKTGGPEGMASLDRIIPAELDDATTASIQEMAVQIFQLFECAGVARIDFMIDRATGTVYFNEINTIPGSFSFYLWEPSGIPFDELMHRTIQAAQQRFTEARGRIRTYDVNLLSERSLSGLKGSKG
ncbi:D-alanine--D-alanine ligase [Longimonas halophila]|uniref:D-alanine--D-alanine ligase n=2 Tax=Longimonas halophila TaxID=1469170 RepID=A0A2H3P9G6_9BACT|nr:D-alanine--D-alanine ligase [Longimonas halophila]